MQIFWNFSAVFEIYLAVDVNTILHNSTGLDLSVADCI